MCLECDYTYYALSIKKGEIYNRPRASEHFDNYFRMQITSNCSMISTHPEKMT